MYGTFILAKEDFDDIDLIAKADEARTADELNGLKGLAVIGKGVVGEIGLCVV